MCIMDPYLKFVSDRMSGRAIDLFRCGLNCAHVLCCVPIRNKKQRNEKNPSHNKRKLFNVKRHTACTDALSNKMKSREPFSVKR